MWSHLRGAGGALLFFTAASVVMLWPLPLHLADTLPDWADPADSSWRLGVIARQLLRDPLHLYQTRAFYPLDNALAQDELLTGQGLLAAPIIWLTANPPLAFNTLILLSFILSGLAMWALVRDLTGSAGAGLVAGLVYAYSPWHIGQLGHLGLGAQQWMVFALLFLRRFLQASAAPARLLAPPVLRPLALFTAFAVFQALVAGYYAYFEAILFGLYLLWYGWVRWRRRELNWRRLGGQAALLAGAAAVGVALLLPFVWPFVAAQAAAGFARPLSEAAYWSAAPTSLLRMDPRSPLYPLQVRLFGLETSGERALYPGLVALALAVIGLLARPGTDQTKGKGERFFFVLLALVGLILSFGPALHWDIYSRETGGLPLPYALLYRLLPGFDALRVPARFGQLFMLGLAGLAGLGMAALLRRAAGRQPQSRRATLALAVGVVLVGAEYWTVGVPTTPTPAGADAPPVVRWLAEERNLPAATLLLELPMGTGDTPINTAPIYPMYGLLYDRPLLNGSANIVPPGYDRLFYEMRRFPAPGTLDLAEGLGVGALVVHRGGLEANRRAQLAEAEAAGRLLPLATFPDLPAAPGAQVTVYRLQPSPGRWAALQAAIPVGAIVLLGDHPGHRRLLTTVLPRLLGPDRQYRFTYSTIYDRLMPNFVLARPGGNYPYAIFYNDPDSAGAPAAWGYSPADRLPNVVHELLAVYRKGR